MSTLPKKPVSPKEQKVADYIVQGLFIVALCGCILIDASYKDFELPLIVYAILGSGAIGAENFINLINRIRGKS